MRLLNNTQAKDQIVMRRVETSAHRTGCHFSSETFVVVGKSLNFLAQEASNKKYDSIAGNQRPNDEWGD